MIKYQVDLNYRFEPDYTTKEWLHLLDTVIDQIGFEDSTIFEVVLEDKNQARHTVEITKPEFGTVITDEFWPTLHQLYLSNQWIKDMNIKFHLVKRQDHVNVTIKCDLDDPARREIIIMKIDELLAAQSEETLKCDDNTQEMEAMFGAMLLSKDVAEKTKSAFLKGNWKGCLMTATDLIIKKTVEKTKVNKIRYSEVINLLTQEVPCLLLPDLSGEKLREELGGLAHLIVGTLTLMKPLVKGPSVTIDEPAAVLKYLVLTSMILERLDNTIVNPAYYQQAKARKAKPKVQPKVKKKAVAIKKKTTVAPQKKKATAVKKKTAVAPQKKKATSVKKTTVVPQKKKTQSVKETKKVSSKKVKPVKKKATVKKKVSKKTVAKKKTRAAVTKKNRPKKK